MEDKNIVCSYCVNDAHHGYIVDDEQKTEVWCCDEHFFGSKFNKPRNEESKVRFVFKPESLVDGYACFGIREAYDGITPKIYKALLKIIDEYKSMKDERKKDL